MSAIVTFFLPRNNIRPESKEIIIIIIMLTIMIIIIITLTIMITIIQGQANSERET